ncbi:MAG: P-loop NTPase fold protein [Dolichospermum sp.]
MTQNTNKANARIDREKAESILKRFLKNEDYSVLAVNGKWGIGKTHLVQNFLYEHTKSYYYYVSIFGISSIEQLKARLIANYKNDLKSDNQSSQTKTELVFNFINKYIKTFFEWLNRIFGKIEKTPKLDILGGLSGSVISIAGDLALEIFFNSIVRENSIICIDDLERKYKIPLEEILGFVENLVQERKCKIILIYNEDELEDKKVLDHYREKVIDREFTLNPTVDENLDLGFKEDHHYLDYLEIIKKVFKKTETNNIRVIRKTEWLIKELIPLMENWEDSLRHQVIKNCIIITAAKLDTDFCKRWSINGIHPIDIILSLSYTPQQYYEKSQGEDRETAGKKFEFEMKIIEMGYSNLEELDELISQLVNTPLSDSIELQFREKGHILNEREKSNQIIKKLNDLANNLYKSKYYNSLADNEQDIIDGIISFLDHNYLNLSIAKFEEIARFTSLLGGDISKYEKPLLEKILKDILESNSDENLSAFRNKLSKYPDLEESFNKKIDEYHQTLDITTAVKNIMNSDPSSRSLTLQKDIEFLRSLTVDKYCQWLQKDDPELIDMVKCVLNSGYNPAPKNLKQAICILAECTRINKIRAKYFYNIDIDNIYNSDNTN